MQKVIRFALDRENKQGVYIKNVKNGLACNCVCELCGGALIAAQGEKYEWHFKHAVESNCLGSQETAIHRLAKQIICSNNRIEIPIGPLDYINPRQEESYQSIRPDIVVLSNDNDVFIEIRVTHPVENITELFYINGKFRSIEIDLRNLPYNITQDDLTQILLFNLDRKRIIYWPDAEKADKKSEGSSKPILIIVIAITIVYFFVKLFTPKNRKIK